MSGLSANAPNVLVLDALGLQGAQEPDSMSAALRFIGRMDNTVGILLQSRVAPVQRNTC